MALKTYLALADQSLYRLNVGHELRTILFSLQSKKIKVQTKIMAQRSSPSI